MADQRPDTELVLEPGVPDPTPEEAARLLAAARRAREDLAAGRAYRASEEGLRAFLEDVGPRFGFPVVDEHGRTLRPVGESEVFSEETRVRLAVEDGLQKGLLEPA